MRTSSLVCVIKYMPGWRLYRKGQKEIFKAVVLNNLTYQQVGERFGITVNTVKTLYYRALKQLKKKNWVETLWCCFLLFCDKFLHLHFVKIIFPAIFPGKVVISFSIFRYIKEKRSR